MTRIAIFIEYHLLLAKREYATAQVMKSAVVALNNSVINGYRYVEKRNKLIMREGGTASCIHHV